MDGMEFFKKTAGKWRSQRVTHHLPFRRAEIGGSEIFVEALGENNPRVVEICQMHEQEPSLAVGGAFVSWDGSMAWDKDDENHEGNTVFALIPDSENPQAGKLLRERGYAEIIPVAGEYHVDDKNGLVLTTEYETMTIFEKFWFINPDIRLRFSTVQRFGGFNTATFCMEVRRQEDQQTPQEFTPFTITTKSQTAHCAISGW
jgi:hypothetical protein